MLATARRAEGLGRRPACAAGHARWERDVAHRKRGGDERIDEDFGSSSFFVVVVVRDPGSSARTG